MALAPSPSLALLGDNPYPAGSDPLGFDELVEDLARLILGSRGATPFTLGTPGAASRGV